MLRLALVDGIRTQPFPGGRGICPNCQSSVIAKCGRIKIHHWAHEAADDCDAWSEPMGPWHLSWQDIVSPEYIEVPIGPHRANILSDDDIVIELQHSSIQPEEIEQREAFYDNMVWLFDATHRFGLVPSGDRAFFSFGRTKHIVACRKPVFLDFGEHVVQVDTLTDKLSQFSGFGRIRDRDWVANTYLHHRRKAGAKRVVVKSKGGTYPWPGKQPWRRTRFPSRWRLQDEERLVSKGTMYIPLNYELVNRRENRRWPVWAGLISRHQELANGWTEAELTAMRDLLNGEPMILEGQLRLMPAPVAKMNVTMTVAAVRPLLQRLADHTNAGRIAILKKETVSALLQKAEEYEVQRFGHRRDRPQPTHRPSERRLFD